MAYIIGVVLFALGIGLSLALHEAGHLLAGKAFGMKVRRYFVGYRADRVLLPPRRDRVRPEGLARSAVSATSPA